MSKWIVILFLSVIIVLSAKEDWEKKRSSVLETVLNVIPEAAANALTLDFPYMLSMASFNTLGIVGTGTRFTAVIPYTIGAFFGQTVRHACKQIYTEGEPSVLCGFAAGSTKYGSRYLLNGGGIGDLPIIALRGAIDIGNYEMDRSSLLAAWSEFNYPKVVSMVYKNELFNEFVTIALQVLLGRVVDVDAEGVKTALLVPTLLNTFSFTVSSPYNDVVKSYLQNAMKETMNSTKSEL